MGWARVLSIGLLALASCEKVPLTDVNAGFSLAQAAWFEEEETLFLFWRVEAEQGLGPDSRIEVFWRTDEVVLPWTAVSEMEPVHTHEEVDCGRTMLCGSMSLRLRERPLEVGLQLRYHRDGALTLKAPLALHRIDAGSPHTHRSLLVYGVHDATNRRVQWRARHRFPTLRNEEVQSLGLRRFFRVLEPSHGELTAGFEGNPYGYGVVGSCPSTFEPLGWEPVETRKRAVFDPHELPVSATASPVVCARSEVTDARGIFEAVAVARKNPEVAAAFPVLRSPIRENTPVGFVLRPCQRTISEPHRAMQVQRLLLDGAPEICIDDWKNPAFALELVSTFRARIDEVRLRGEDMVLFVALHQDVGPPLAQVLEAALEEVLAFEAQKSSPRVSGAFVLDSLVHRVSSPVVRRLALWCPAYLPDEDDLEEIPSTAERTCPVQPDLPELALGPFRFSNLPILPTRAQYLRFLERYSEAQAGRTLTVTTHAPELTPVSQHVPIGEFGVATFFNDEVLTATPTEAFSFCASDDLTSQIAVFRIPGVPDLLPLAMLPELHATMPQSTYALGLGWDFPFLLRLEYEVVIAGAAAAYGFTVPFGVALPSEAYYGTGLWLTGEFDLSSTLLRCSRFCDHPTFDSAGVYNVLQPFRTTYASLCYRPRYPVEKDGGFPRDP